MKKALSLILALGMTISLAACGQNQAAVNTNSTVANSTVANSTETVKEDPMVFGIAMPQLDNDGFKANLVGIKQFAEENNIELIITDGKASADSQMQQVEDLITKKVDAIVMCPVDSGAAAAAVVKANAANIPVVSFDRNISGGVLAGLAESDNTAHGAAGADLMKEAAENSGMKVEDLIVLELLGTLSTTAGLQRHTGFSERAMALGISIVAALPTEFKNDTAYNAVLDAFQANPNINAIFVPSDNALYSGVESALRQLGKLVPLGEKGHILITTVDGGPQGLKGIRNHFIDAIASQSKLVMSEKAMDLALMAAKGETIKESIIRIQPTPVTITNVDDITLWANAINQ